MKRADDVRSALQDRIVEVVQALYPAAQKDGNSFRLGNLQGEPGTSLSIEVVRKGAQGAWTDFSTNEKGGIFDLIQASQGLDFKQALVWACSFLGLSPSVRTFAAPLTREGTEISFANLRALEANERRLQQNPDALAYLNGEWHGLTRTTIQHFRLGLSSYIDKSTGTAVYEHALSYPQMDSKGQLRSRFLRSRIPGVTTGIDEKKDWASGLPSTYWVTPAAARQDLLVCEGAKDGWRLWQELQGTSLASRLCIVTSTHGSVIPEEWKTPAFWASWDTVYAGQDADESGDSMALKVREHAARDIRRLRVPDGKGKDWTEYLNSGASSRELQHLLWEAPVVTQSLAETPVTGVVPFESGFYHVTPVDLSRAFINGFLYYPFRALEVEQQEGRRLQRWRDLILRSDGTICKADYLPAAQGTPKEDRVLALDDGTILTKMPSANPLWTTFTTDAINLFSIARKERRSALTLSPGEMLVLIDRHLRSKVILPYDHDYAVLTYVAVTSYVQPIFEAIPLVLIVGVAGSGKSELGAALAQVSCNAVVLNGQTSAASVARIMDGVGGLAVLDDLEGIGSNTKNKREFNDLIQQLKVSYKKATARKAWTNTQTMRVEELNFYGIKVINNTEGTDAILGTRMLKIYTRKINDRTLAEYERPPALRPEELTALRTNLHIWAMEHAQDIATLYEEKFSRHNERQEEITAPLRLLAELMGDALSAERLALALKAHDQAPKKVESSVDLLKMAVKELIRQGCREYIAMPQLELEMRRLTGGETWAKSSTTEIPEWQEPRWVGRQLRTSLMVNLLEREERPRLWGQQIRLYPLEAGFVAETLNELNVEGIAMATDSIRPLAYCEDVQCGSCPYAGYCKFQERKLAHLQKRGQGSAPLH